MKKLLPLLAAGMKERSVAAFEHALTLTDGNPSMTLRRLRQAQTD